MDINIRKQLIESLKQNNDLYKNVINAKHPYPCGICQKNVNNNQKAIECSNCKYWIHIKCNGTTDDEYRKMVNENDLMSESDIALQKWLCYKCTISNMAALFPFGLENDYELKNVLNNESLKILDNLPTFDIYSKANSLDSLKQFDIDENVIIDINSRYYPVSEFQNLKLNNSFLIMHSNLNGLENKFDEYHNFVSNTKMDIDLLCISETSQKEGFDFLTNVNIEGYKIPFTIGSKTSKGGVAIYAKKELNVVERKDLNCVNISFECLWVEIINEKHKNIICGCIYRHPKSDVDEFNKYLTKCLTKINREKKECYIAGDFNIDLLKYESNNTYAEFLNTLTSNGFLPHILQPTRITEYSATVIDNIFGNNFVDKTFSGNILIKFADHFSQFLCINREITKLKPSDTYRIDYSNFNEKLFVEDVSIQNWFANVSRGTNAKFDDFIWRLEDCVNRHAPLKKLNKKQLNKISKPWITKFILKMISHRDKLFHKKKINPMDQIIKATYIMFRNRVTREIRKSKKEYYRQYFENNLNNMKKTWQGIKQIIKLNNSNKSVTTQLICEGKLVNNNKDMAEVFNVFFTDIGKQLDKKIPHCKKTGATKQYLKPNNLYSFLISPTSPLEICNLIKSLDVSKSPGPSPVPVKLLKLVSFELSVPLSLICNASFDEGVFPEQNKIAMVIPSHKNGALDDVNNYRPISLLSVFSKIMEKLMASRLTNFLELHEIIYPNQFGFRAGYSTSHSLISITENIRKSLDNGKFGCGVFIDLKKAFDTVNHDILLTKLENYGIRDEALDWFKSYLINRRQYVHLNGVNSSTRNISCGVPQGSVLGPILFLLYINDLPNISDKLKFYLYADDTNIYFESKNLKLLERTMNKELDKLYEWLCINRLSLNISKTNFVIFCPPSKPKVPITIKINKEAIDESQYVKYLGILIDSELSFKYHIVELKKKISRSIGVLYRLRPFVNTKILFILFYYMVLLYGVMLV